MNNYRLTSNSKSQLNYHFVFCPRRRRKIFNIEGVEIRFKEIITSTCSSMEIQIIEIHCGIDYVHISVNALPDISPLFIMNKIKELSSKLIKEEFLELSKVTSLWTRNFLVSNSENLCQEDIISYVNEQRTRS